MWLVSVYTKWPLTSRALRRWEIRIPVCPKRQPNVDGKVDYLFVCSIEIGLPELLLMAAEMLKFIRPAPLK